MKLWEVTIEESYFALAETPAEAQKWVRQHIRNGSEWSYWATEVKNPRLVETDELVYHDGDEDITLADCAAILNKETTK